MKIRQLMFRWSLVTGGLIALFWAVYYLIAGDVPVVISIKMTKEWIITLPFGISRWCDILIGPIYSIFLILLFTNKKLKEGHDLRFHIVSGMIMGLFMGAFGGLVSDLASNLFLVLFFILFFSSILGFVLGVNSGLVSGLISGFSSFLVSVLVLGLISGIVSVLVSILIFGLVFELVVLIKIIAGAKFWLKIWDWLLVR